MVSSKTNEERRNRQLTTKIYVAGEEGGRSDEMAGKPGALPGFSQGGRPSCTHDDEHHRPSGRPGRGPSGGDPLCPGSGRRSILRPRFDATTGRRPRAGPGGRSPWARPALLSLLGATAVLYLWGLGASGWANSFYSAAVQAGTHSWKAFFFGSSDSANAITVDKPPVALWVMGLSARLFGTNAWSILVPEALAGVATVGLLYASVKRWFGAGPGLIAGAILATTPVAALMFRFNNPDAMLVLLLVGAAYALVRALETISTRWLVLAWTPRRLRLPHQDAPGAVGGSGIRARLPGVRADDLASTNRAVGVGVRRPRGVRRVVGGGGQRLAGVQSPVHRRLAAQLHRRADRRVQRSRPAHGQRDRQRRRGRRWWQHRQLGPDRLEPDVQQRVREPGGMAAPGRPHAAGRRSSGEATGAPHRPGPGRPAHLGRLAGGDPGRVQLRRRDHPPLLHGGAGAGRRCPGRDRPGSVVAPSP